VPQTLGILVVDFFKQFNTFCLIVFFRLTEFVCVDYKTGFGGQFGVQSDRVDKSALGKSNFIINAFF